MTDDKLLWNRNFRQLEEGEVIEPTDEVQNDDGTWGATICAGMRAPNPLFTAHRIYRRSLANKETEK